jgi:hypothetical protein
MIPEVIVSLPRVVHVGRAHVFEARPCQIKKFTGFTEFVKFTGTPCTFRFKDLSEM